MKKLFQIILLITFTLSMSSCYYDEIYEAELPDDTEVFFAADILEIFDQYNCANCHNGSQDPDLSPGNEYNSLVPDYVEPGNASGSELYTTLLGGHANLDNTSLQLIEIWINNGANNN